MRFEFMSKALTYPPLAEVLNNTKPLILGAINAQGLRAIIEEPAKVQGISLEDGLTDLILKDVIQKEEPGNLPLLEFALSELWTRQSHHKLTPAAYEQIGGVERALNAYAKREYENLSEDERNRARKIFIQLVSPGSRDLETPDTRRIANISDFGKQNEVLIDKLADARLLMTGRKNLNSREEQHHVIALRESVEIIHEALIRGWGLLGGWVDDNRDFRLWQDQQLRVALNQWLKNDRSNDSLLTGDALKEAEKWLHIHRDELPEQERTFIEESLQHSDEYITERKRILRQERRSRYVGFAGSILLCFIVLFVYCRTRGLSLEEIEHSLFVKFLEVIEAKTLDFRFRLRGNRDAGNNIVIIALDRKTKKELGRWESAGRLWLAQMLNWLSTSGAKVIGLDIGLNYEDPGPVSEAVDKFKKACQERIALEICQQLEQPDFEAIERMYDYDLQLAAAITKAGNVILAYSYPDKKPNEQPEKVQITEEVQIMRQKGMAEITTSPEGITDLSLQKKESVSVNAPVFANAAKGFGFSNVRYDADSYIRQAPLLLEYDGKAYPSFALKVVHAYWGDQKIRHTVNPDTGSFISMGNQGLPTDEKGNFLINYYSPGGQEKKRFTYWSMVDVIQGKIPQRMFNEKIVLFGFPDPINHDVYSTPFQPETFPGVEIHATIIANLLNDDFLRPKDYSEMLDILILLLLGITLAVIFLCKIRPLAGFFITGAYLIMIGWGGYRAFLDDYRIPLNLTFPCMLVIMEYLLMTTYKYRTEERGKRKLEHAVDKYAPLKDSRI